MSVRWLSLNIQRGGWQKVQIRAVQRTVVETDPDSAGRIPPGLSLISS